ncbi:hypothetical protein [Glaciimonas soli]|uniref:Uncharacterized protein n=1 Tax=Glaciimonas soli TaxID=2590999 RepID=A0A843YSJ8_9BURK|nr:hypothetical protein [Glaciimonas soli]MQR00967.1 hypothetical protein [Glaciimonas soli]
MADEITHKPSGKVATNPTKNSIADIKHPSPTFILYGRIAAGVIGYVGGLNTPDLHFTLFIDDGQGGSIGIDGQPTLDVYADSRPFQNVKFIRSNFYRNTTISGVVIKIPLQPPAGMSNHIFAQKLMEKAYSFASYTLPYSAPENIGGTIMREGEYNSNSYMAGLLNSVMGSVPKISHPNYLTPGWETPIPSSYFKGESGENSQP